MKTFGPVAIVVLGACIVLALSAGCGRTASTSGPAVSFTGPVKVDLSAAVASGMTIKAIDVSLDRRRVLVDGLAGSGSGSGRKCFIVDTEKGCVTPLASLVAGHQLPPPSAVGAVRLSPDGCHVAMVFAVAPKDGAGAQSSIQILDAMTGRAESEISVPGTRSITWSGSRLLLSASGATAVQAYDLKKKALEDLTLYARIIGASADGTRLMVMAPKDPSKPPSAENRGSDVMVVTLQGKVLRNVVAGGSQCPLQDPLISASGRFATTIRLPVSTVSVHTVSVDDGQETDLQPWHYFQAVSDSGEPISCGRGKIEIGRAAWETLVDGETAKAGKVVGNEFFYVSEPGWVLKSVPLPKPVPAGSAPPVPTPVTTQPATL
jgi:hypothetical protein